MKTISTIAVRFLSVVIMTFWVGTALADKRVALIIGNSQYTHISPIVNPANDAQDIAQALESIGFDVILKTDLRKGEFELALAAFARKATGADAALFYYAGHGLQSNKRNFFLPTDIEVKDAVDVDYRAIDHSYILRAIERASGVKIVILDACRDNPLIRQLTPRSLGIGGGLARIDSAEDTIFAYATSPDHVANDGEGRNSPFTAALLKRIKEPGLEITTMFRRVAHDVYEKTGGGQQPEITTSLRTDFYLNPAESDSAAWSRVRESTDAVDFKEFIRKFPASPFAREAQFRIDLFDRIIRENEEAKKEAKRQAQEAEQKRQAEAAKREAERLALEAESKRHEEAAKKETERLALEAESKRREEAAKKETGRLALEAERKRHEEAAKKEAGRLALEAERKRQDEAAARTETEPLAAAAAKKQEEDKKEAEQLQAEKRAAEERTKLAALEEGARKKHEIAQICDGDLITLKDLTATLQTAAIEKLAKETACPTMKPAVETALKKVEREVKRACTSDRKKLASLKDSDIDSVKTAVEHMSCESVRAEGQQRVAKLEDEFKRNQSICADEKVKLGAIDESAFQARQQYAEFLAHAGCPALRADVNGTIKKIDSRVKEAQKELVRLGCYSAPVNGKFDDATKQSLALYGAKKGSFADGDHLTDGLVSELKQQNLGICPPDQPAAPVIATPVPDKTKEPAKKEEAARPGQKEKKIEADEGPEVPAVSRPSRRHKIESAAREEQPVARPPKHRTRITAREEEWSPRPHPRAPPAVAVHRPRHVAAAERIRRAPRMPMSPAAGAGAGAAVHGVGF